MAEADERVEGSEELPVVRGVLREAEAGVDGDPGGIQARGHERRDAGASSSRTSPTVSAYVARAPIVSL
ncbi:hypothetical protein MAFF212519_24290 [Clavibacter michiganensis]